MKKSNFQKIMNLFRSATGRCILSLIIFFVFLIVLPSLSSACLENYFHLNVSGNASGYIEFHRSPSYLWYTGFSVPGDGGGPYSGIEAILPYATHSPILRFLPPDVGQIWTYSGFANGYPVDATAEVMSVSENISVTAGNFSNCAKVDTNLSYPSGYTPGWRYPVKFERWFCPGVGPAKFILTEDDGTQYSGELTSYQNIPPGSIDYFPLGLNYTWTFVMNTGRSATWTVDVATAVTDTDGDGIPDDGNMSYVIGDAPCTGGNTVNCDDNCIDTPNPGQADADNDGIGDACDFAGAVGGMVSYSGSQTGNVYIGLYTSPVITPAAKAEYSLTLTSPGPYQFSGVADGTYYAAAIVTQNQIDVEKDDPYGMYGIVNPGDSPTSIVISGGSAVTGMDFTLFDSTPLQPNAFYSPWDLVAPLNKARDQFTCGVINGKIYAFGGNGDPCGFNLKSTEVYDPATNSWTFVADNNNNFSHGVEELSGAVVNGKFYVFGATGLGVPPYGDFNFVEEYDPVTDTWTSKDERLTAGHGVPAAEYNGEIYLFGGQTHGSGNKSYYDVVEAYDPSTNTWRAVTNMPRLTTMHAVAVVGDKAYVFGGYDPDQDIMISDVRAYDFLTDQWTTTGLEPLSSPRAFVYANAAPIIDGKIYLIGGGEGNATSFWIVDTVEIYDPLANSWSTGESLPQITDDFCSVVLGNSIHIMGGVTDYSKPEEVRTNAVWKLDLLSTNGLWKKYPGNPVFSFSGSGAWDDPLGGVSVLKDPDEPIYTYKMWYVAGATAFGEGMSIGYAKSSDGINWIPYSSNPVMTHGNTWDINGFSGINIIKDGSTYKLWYEGVDINGVNRIGYATSSDGINWTPDASNPVFSPDVTGSWDDDDVGDPWIIKEGSLYKMWYWGDNQQTDIDQIGLATSNDGINWQRSGNNPVLTPNQAILWENGEGVGTPKVIKNVSGYIMTYNGTDQTGTIRVGLATSIDGSTWIKSNNNPILSVGATNDWDSIGVGAGAFIEDDSTMKLWYLGLDSNNIMSVGLATPRVSIIEISKSIEHFRIPAEMYNIDVGFQGDNTILNAVVQSPDGQTWNLVDDGSNWFGTELSFPDEAALCSFASGDYIFTAQNSDGTTITTAVLYEEPVGGDIPCITQEPLLTYPPDGAIDIPSPVTFEWDPVTDTNVLQIGLDWEPVTGSGLSGSVSIPDRFVTEYGPVDLSPDTDYEVTFSFNRAFWGNNLDGIPYVIDADSEQKSNSRTAPCTDVDGDGVFAEGGTCGPIDNCIQTHNPGQQDTNGDGYGNACDADLDNNGSVGGNDFNIFKAAWLSSAGDTNWNPDADMDSNDSVGGNDFNLFKARWLTSEPWY